MRRLPALVLVVSLAFAFACAPGPGKIEYATGKHARVTHDGLHLVEDSIGTSGVVFLKPGANLGGFDKVMMDPVQIHYKRGVGRVLAASEMEIFERDFQNEFEGQLRKSKGYRLVSQPGPDVLRVSAEIIDLEITAPKEHADSESVFVNASGMMTLVLLLSDSETHEPLLRAADRRVIADPGNNVYATSSTTSIADVRFLFEHWALELRGWLDHVRVIPPLPAGDASG